MLDIYRIIFGPHPTLAVIAYPASPPPTCTFVLTRPACGCCGVRCAGLLIILAELRLRFLLVWFSFLLYYIGLGFFYFFVGGLALGDNWSHSLAPLRTTHCRHSLSRLALALTHSYLLPFHGLRAGTSGW